MREGNNTNKSKNKKGKVEESRKCTSEHEDDVL